MSNPTEPVTAALDLDSLEAQIVALQREYALSSSALAMTDPERATRAVILLNECLFVLRRLRAAGDGQIVALLRELHGSRPGTVSFRDGVELDPPLAVTYCTECEFVEWPCPTIQILSRAAGDEHGPGVDKLRKIKRPDHGR
jgi:hypothetical protein